MEFWKLINWFICNDGKCAGQQTQLVSAIHERVCAFPGFDRLIQLREERLHQIFSLSSFSSLTHSFLSPLSLAGKSFFSLLFHQFFPFSLPRFRKSSLSLVIHSLEGKELSQQLSLQFSVAFKNNFDGNNDVNRRLPVTQCFFLSPRKEVGE